MLVWPARDLRQRRRDIGHLRIKLFRQLVMTKKLREPAALVDELAQVCDHDIANLAALELFSAWLL